jgi:murein DD-endopeptidase MepM/ murein hydrolase activator NlpD
MSQRTASQSHPNVRPHHPAHPGHEAARRPEPRQRSAPSAAVRASYTIAHAGRQVRFGPVAFWIAVGTIVVMAGWSLTTATYFAFHDDVLKGLLARERAQQYAYEDRIADLRAELDRTTSRQLLDDDQLHRKLGELLRRQAKLESRASALAGVADRDTTGSIAAPSRTAPRAKPTAFDNMLFVPRPLSGDKQSSIETELKHVSASLERVNNDEIAALDRMQTRYGDRVRQVRGVLDSLGLNYHVVRAGIGGPFVPVRLPPANEGFARALTLVSIARAQAEDLSSRLVYVPLRKPLAGQLLMTSPFGVRIDPFNREPSMHPGIDFRADVGQPIYATAAGKVTHAGWDGGYGKMVQIDHGEGLVTRYGHMSQVDVAVGQHVHAGQVIGHVGSTGRSTGPHLHYEIRVNGEAINPAKFLAAGEKLYGGETIARADQRGYED